MKGFALALLTVFLWSSHQSVAFAATTNVYFTQFEAGEGYSTNFTLVGQAGWEGDGTGDNGVVNQYLLGQGQQALVGGYSPLPADESLVVWRPIDFNPIAAGYPIVKFSVLMNIADSLNDQWDLFRWSVYNMQGRRLFSLDFDNYPYNDYQNYLGVGYRLDGTNTTQFTGLKYVNNSNYTLTVTMNFASNRWSATLNNSLITTNQLITTTNAQLTLGDVDAVWLIYETNAPGDNYMLFDNYRITAETIPLAPVTPAQVQFLGRTGEGWALLQVFGDNNSRWALDATTNLVSWTALETNQILGTHFDHIDDTAAGLPRRFYRARHVP